MKDSLDPTLAALLHEFPVVIEVPIWWGDQDAFGHVNNAVPLKWFESSRIAYAGKIGLWESLETQKIGPILASIRCDYRLQLRFPDSVLVGARIVRIGRTSLTMDHRVVSRELRDVALDGTSTLVVFDYSAQSPRPVPDPIRRKIAELEGRQIDVSSPAPPP